jgi:YegS/Rv2252/BmrU family lipid kinase
MPRAAVVIANPASGRGRAERVARELALGLEQQGFAVDLHLTQSRGDASAHLRSRGAELAVVVAVGGDGTLRECFEGLARPEIPVALVPLGTANVLAQQLGLPRDTPRALEVVARGRTQAIDVARVNGRLSFLVTSAGIDAATVRALEERRRGPITKWSYVPAFAAALRGYQPPRITVEVDGEALPGTQGLVIVSNVAFYGGVLRLDPTARLDDGLFEVYLFPTGRFLELARAFARGAVRHLPGGPVRALRGRSVRLAAEGEVPYQVDGDMGASLPLALDVEPTRYHVLAP